MNSLKKIVGNLIFFYPLVYIFLYTIEPGISRRFFIILFILLIMGSLKSVIEADKYRIRNILVLFMLGLVSSGVIMRSGASEIFTNQDIYGFMGLILIFSLMTQDDYREEVLRLCIDLKKYKIVIFGFFFMVLIGIIFKNGLRAEGWGVSVPLLYGQFEIPHSLAYMLLGIYALSSIQFMISKSKLALYTMGLSFVCVVWTGVRSALVSLLVLLVLDFIKIKNKNKKIITIFCLLVGVALLATFTDILTNNPLMQKTANAAAKGTVSNGRDEFAQVLIGYYLLMENMTQRIVGIGINGIRQVMFSVYGTAIHAHNDVLNVLLGYGFAGTLVFWSSFISFCHKVKHGYLVFIILFVLALTNGLFMYISFSPTVVIISIYIQACFDKTDMFKKIIDETGYEYKSIFYLG